LGALAAILASLTTVIVVLKRWGCFEADCCEGWLLAEETFRAFRVIRVLRDKLLKSSPDGRLCGSPQNSHLVKKW